MRVKRIHSTPLDSHQFTIKSNTIKFSFKIQLNTRIDNRMEEMKCVVPFRSRVHRQLIWFFIISHRRCSSMFVQVRLTDVRLDVAQWQGFSHIARLASRPSVSVRDGANNRWRIARLPDDRMCSKIDRIRRHWLGYLCCVESSYYHRFNITYIYTSLLFCVFFFEIIKYTWTMQCTIGLQLIYWF